MLSYLVSLLFNKKISEGSEYNRKIQQVKKQQELRDNPQQKYIEKSEQKAIEIQELNDKINQCLRNASILNSQNRKQEALNIMRSKKILEKKRNMLQTHKDNYDKQILVLDTTKSTNTHIIDLNEVNESIKKERGNITVDDVSDLMTDVEETKNQVEEISEYLTGSIEANKDHLDIEIEEEELMKELEDIKDIETTDYGLLDELNALPAVSLVSSQPPPSYSSLQQSNEFQNPLQSTGTRYGTISNDNDRFPAQFKEPLINTMPTVSMQPLPNKAQLSNTNNNRDGVEYFYYHK